MAGEREVLCWDLFGTATREVAQMVADDVADTGHTLLSVQTFCAGKVGEVRTAVLYEKSHSLVKCDYVWRRTDRWIDFPWSDKHPVTGTVPSGGGRVAATSRRVSAVSSS